MGTNFDKLLKKIEKNKETENEQQTFEFNVAGETFEVKTLTRKRKADYIYMQEAGKKKMTVGDIIKQAKPFIYESLQLAPLAAKAKDAGYIKSYYDVIDALFEPEEIIEILSFIAEINNISEKDVKEEIEETKKP